MRLRCHLVVGEGRARLALLLGLLARTEQLTAAAAAAAASTDASTDAADASLAAAAAALTDAVARPVSYQNKKETTSNHSDAQFLF